MNQKCVISQIVRKFYEIKSNDCTYLIVQDNGGMNQQNDVTYDLQCTNREIIITITIITNHVSMICGINMYKTKQLYQYKHNNLTFRIYFNDCFNNEDCDFNTKNCTRNVITLEEIKI